MTVNERLFEAKLLDEFDAASRRQDRDSMLELVRSVDVETAEWSVDQILAAPKRYGFKHQALAAAHRHRAPRDGLPRDQRPGVVRNRRTWDGRNDLPSPIREQHDRRRRRAAGSRR